MQNAKKLWIVMFFSALSLVAWIGVSFGATMMINFDNGNVVTYDTSKIISITFSDSGTSGGWTERQSGLQIEGLWATTEGEMALQQNGRQVRGTYATKDGRVEGTLRGNTLEGYWTQSTSGRACSYQRDGRMYWGRIVYHFDGSSSFTGTWGYCDDNPANPWNGKRK